jgi:hypothetical protein
MRGSQALNSRINAVALVLQLLKDMVYIHAAIIAAAKKR